jgi:hypothetical protein
MQRRKPSLGCPRPVWFPLLLAAACLLGTAAAALGQTEAAPGATPGGMGGLGGGPGALFSNQPSLFPNDGRIKLLVLALNPAGLTESAAEQVALILQKNLANTGHFAVVGPRELASAFEKEHPDLADCREIPCGVEGGRILGADRVAAGSIRLEDTRFALRIRLIDPDNNLTDYDEEVRFTEVTMDDELFRLANSISRNQPRIGRILSTSVRGLVIGLGKRQGLKIGDVLVVYKQDQPITNLQGEQVDLQRKNVAIIRILNVNESTSDAILVHQVEDPQVGHYAKTYLDPVRQIEMVENTRRELDTGLRLANRVRPLELAPVLLADSERKRWQKKLADAEAKRGFWLMVTGIAAAASAYSAYTYEPSTMGQLKLFGSLAATGYAGYEWLTARELVNTVSEEGRAKGYVDLMILPGPQGPLLAFSLKF